MYSKLIVKKNMLKNKTIASGRCLAPIHGWPWDLSAHWVPLATFAASNPLDSFKVMQLIHECPIDSYTTVLSVLSISILESFYINLQESISLSISIFYLSIYMIERERERREREREM